MVATFSKAMEILNFSENKPTKNHLEELNLVQKQRGARFIPCFQNKTISNGDVVAMEANQVLSSPLTVSTQRVEPITSKDTVLDEVLVLAKSKSEYGSRKPENLTLKSH